MPQSGIEGAAVRLATLALGADEVAAPAADARARAVAGAFDAALWGRLGCCGLCLFFFFFDMREIPLALRSGHPKRGQRSMSPHPFVMMDQPIWIKR
jgi:hypothetical protein